MKAASFISLAALTLHALSLHAHGVPQLDAQWTTTPPVIDGRLNDPAWLQAPEHGGFTKLTDGSRPKAPTFVRVLTDGKALYLGFRCVEPAMEKLAVTQKNHDDPVWNDDSLEVILDPDNRKASQYHLILNSAGAHYDARGAITLPETSNDEPQWNGKWDSVCSRGKGEWYAEVRLPFEVFGISPTNGGCIGLNLGRSRVGAVREESSWAPTRVQYVNPACLGELYLADNGKKPLQVVLPQKLDQVCGNGEIPLEFASRSQSALPVQWHAVLKVKSQQVERTGSLTLPASRSATAKIPFSIAESGNCELALTVRAAGSQQVLYRGARSFRLLPEVAVAEDLYALGYARAEARVMAHLPARQIRGAVLQAELVRPGETAVLGTCSQGVKPGGTNTVSFSLRDREAGNYAIRVRLVKGREVLAVAESRALPFTPNPAVGFDPNGFLTVQGQPWFPVGLYTIQAKSGSHEEVMEEARQAGFNSTVFYAYTVDTITPLLDAAQRHGLRAFVYPANPFRVREQKATREELVGEIQARRHHPALLGWYLVDEPEGIGVASVETVRNYYQLVKETDPGHPCSLVIMSPRAAANYGDSADIVWIDPYPVPHSPVTYVSECMDGARDSVAKDKPVWTIPQAFDWSVWRTGKVDTIHRPTPAEERCMTYLALVHGAKGIIYWAHTASKYYIRDYPEHWAALKNLAGELRDLSPVLLTTNSTRALQITPRTATLDTLVKELDGATYVFAVNREPVSTEARLALKGKRPSQKVEVLFEKRTINGDRHGWVDHFGPLEVHVYRLTGSP